MNISRRAVLRGAGVAMALPWLESLPVFGATSGEPKMFPRRFAVLFMGNGINGNHWWAKGSSAAMQLSRSLAPLEPVKTKINVINGLFNKPAVGRGIHPAQTGNLLSGVPLQKGPSVRSGIPVDQILAPRHGCERRIEPTRGARNHARPDDPREHARLMCDIIALAFQTDTTRVASLILARDLSSLSYRFLGVRDDHHTASHDDLSDAYEGIVRFHVSQLAYLARKLDAMPEGDGTVLDNCCLLWLSNMWSGWKHDNMKLPVVTAGGLGGALATGRALEYLYAGDENRKLCSLYLSIMDKMGVTLDRFGDADTPLEHF